jgi:phosphate transport system permease protein
MNQQVQTISAADAATLLTVSRRRLVQAMHIRNRIALGVLWAITTIVALIFIVIIVYLIVKGFTALFDPTFYSTGDAGIGPELFNTFYMLILSEIFLFPIALAAAIYLIEYAPQGAFVTVIHFAAETLAGVPSIVLGLFGFIVFGATFGFHISRIAGALTLLCLNLPLALRLFEDALASVPRELKEGGLALGATKWQTIRTVILPSALPGIVTGLILSAGKIIGEAAALIFTAGAFNPINVFTLNPLIGSDTLTVHLWFIETAGAGSTSLTAAQANTVAAGSATLLILVLLVINLGARGVGRLITRRITAA